MSASGYQGDFVCYSWADREVVHRHLTWAEVSSDGRHRGCGHKVAIWQARFDDLDLQGRHELVTHGVKRSYTTRIGDDDETIFRLWGISAHYPSSADYVEELRRKLGLDDAVD